MRLLADTGQIDRLLEITSQEGFYEGGFPRELRTVIADVAQDPGRDAVDRLDAHSALASWAYGKPTGRPTRATSTPWKSSPRRAAAGSDHVRRSWWPSASSLCTGTPVTTKALDATFRTALAELLAPSLLERSLRYGYVQGLYHVGSYRAAGPAALELADAYCVHLGLDLANLHGPTEALHKPV